MLPASALPSSQHPQWWRLPGGPQRSWRRLAYLSHQITTVSVINHWFHIINHWFTIFFSTYFTNLPDFFPSSTTIWGASHSVCVCLCLPTRLTSCLHRAQGVEKLAPQLVFLTSLEVKTTRDSWDLMIDHPPNLPSGNLLHSYWKWPFIVDFPIKNSDFP